MNLTDAEIIAQARDDPRRFGAIFDRHVDQIHRGLRRARRRVDAAD